MNQSLQAIAEQYNLNTALLDRVLRDFNEDKIHAHPIGKANPAHWILGHITASRFAIARMIGLEMKVAWEDKFGQDVTVEDAGQYPSTKEVRAAFTEVSEAMRERFEELTAEDLAGDVAWQPPGMDKTVRGALNFLAFHESYHLGQIGYIRKLVDLEGAFG